MEREGASWPSLLLKLIHVGQTIHFEESWQYDQLVPVAGSLHTSPQVSQPWTVANTNQWTSEPGRSSNKAWKMTVISLSNCIQLADFWPQTLLAPQRSPGAPDARFSSWQLIQLLTQPGNRSSCEAKKLGKPQLGRKVG